jgi:hypothetical protein
MNKNDNQKSSRLSRIFIITGIICLLLSITIIMFNRPKEYKKNRQHEADMKLLLERTEVLTNHLLNADIDSLNFYREKWSDDWSNNLYKDKFGELAQSMIAKTVAKKQNETTNLKENKIPSFSAEINKIASSEKETNKALLDSLNALSSKTDSLANELANNDVKALSFLSIKSKKGGNLYYVGEIENGKANGKGISVSQSGSVYEGQWKDNNKHGYGNYKWADGERYEGEYQNDLRHGNGTYFWKNGQRYMGQWVDDKREGKGAIYNKNGKLKIKGTWKDDQIITNGK